MGAPAGGARQGGGHGAGDEGLADTGRPVQQQAPRGSQAVLDVELGVGHGQFDGVAYALDGRVQSADHLPGGVGGVVQKEVLDLAAGDAAQGDAVLEVGHQGVAGPQADGDQGGGQAQDAGVLAAHGDQNVALVQALLDGDEFTDVVRLGRGHRVEALIEDEGGTGLQAAQRQCGRGRHPHPPSGHDDVDGAGHGVDDGHMRGEGERGRRQALDLLLGGRQLPAGRCQGAGQAAVLAHEHVGVGSARIGWGDSGGFDGPGWFSSAGCCGGGVGGAPGTGIGAGAMRLRGCRFALIHVLLLRLGGGRRPSGNRSGTLVPERG